MNVMLIYTHDYGKLTGGTGADVFSCGKGEDTITDYNPDEGDVKAADCENF
jgi:hypothetical protein